MVMFGFSRTFPMKWAILVVLDYNISGARVLDFFLYCIYFQDRFSAAVRFGGPWPGRSETRRGTKRYDRVALPAAAENFRSPIDDLCRCRWRRRRRLQVLLYFKMLQAANCRFDFLKIYLKYVQTCVCRIHIRMLARLFRIINIFKYLLLLALPH